MKPSTKTVAIRRGGLYETAIVGRRETEMPPAPQPEPFEINQVVDNERREVRITVSAKKTARVVTKRVKKRVSTKKPVSTVSTDAARVKAWRAENRERYNAYMRKHRAKLKAKEVEK